MTKTWIAEIEFTDRDFKPGKLEGYNLYTEREIRSKIKHCLSDPLFMKSRIRSLKEKKCSKLSRKRS